jgi:hypothetical protein
MNVTSSNSPKNHLGALCQHFIKGVSYKKRSESVRCLGELTSPAVEGRHRYARREPMSLFWILTRAGTPRMRLRTRRRVVLQPTPDPPFVMTLLAVGSIAGIQRVDRLGPIRRRIDDPMLGEIVENVLGQLLPLSRQPVLHLALVGEEDLLHATQDHFVCLHSTAVVVIFPCGGALSRRRWLARRRRMGAGDNATAS